MGKGATKLGKIFRPKSISVGCGRTKCFGANFLISEEGDTSMSEPVS